MTSDGLYDSRRFSKPVSWNTISKRALRIAGAMAKRGTRGV
jgi:hypothetical protein